MSLFCALLSLAGCSPHKIDIQQGNVVTAEKLTELKVGMEQRQVRFLLGTPLVQDAFHANRWDYFYSYKPGKGERAVYRVSLYFENERLARIENEGELPGNDYVNPVKRD